MNVLLMIGYAVLYYSLKHRMCIVEVVILPEPLCRAASLFFARRVVSDSQ